MKARDQSKKNQAGQTQGGETEMEERELKYLLALYSLPGMSQRQLKILVDYFQSFEYAWQQSDRWLDISGFCFGHGVPPKKNCPESQADRVLDQFFQADARIITLEDQDYPKNLKNIYDPPSFLFYRGKLPKEEEQCIAMVGSRKATAYGRLMAETIARDLAKESVWVVSGLARGIDTWSHKGCLKADGKTMAVLGCGIDVVYPRENRELYQEIAEKGVILSEFPLGAPPLQHHFPMRNRIISGVSKGVLVVEAAEKSGSLITVDYALEQGRDVFALPGPVTSPLSRGTHKLILQGAKLVEKAQDILEEYLEGYGADYGQKEQQPEKTNLFTFSQQERELLELLTGGSVHFDQLAEQSGLGAPELAALLTQWEIKGLIKQTPGKYYMINVIL
ncbi:DNA-processing protein DprA [Dehalobacterium formicoaceticum]|uniref:DNA-processing protein DprA n=1 Tax=Dehalobacterium formicoaceticum TaxID=51515 RepID=A0ABT1Y2A3_9FIRM|nr:DNA-processing protein DprA [Dehalobacterium formicoaceticum]MCR6544688.1 DNA-processing protein DprA [Dehalobacterium formicoaceticum]